MKRLTFFMVAIMALCLTAIAQKQSSKTLVAYFSATGTTEKAAKVVAEVTGGTLYEIQPAKKYTSAIWIGTTSPHAAVWRWRMPNHVLL